MNIKIDVKFEMDEEGLIAAIEAVNAEVLEEIAKGIMEIAKNSMRKFDGIPSLPFRPPKSRTGKLKRSIHYAKEKPNLYIIGPSGSCWYGSKLELGGAKLLPRPFMKPALQKIKSNIPKYFKNKKLSRTVAGRRLNERFRNYELRHSSGV